VPTSTIRERARRLLEELLDAELQRVVTSRATWTAIGVPVPPGAAAAAQAAFIASNRATAALLEAVRTTAAAEHAAMPSAPTGATS